MVCLQQTQHESPGSTPPPAHKTSGDSNSDKPVVAAASSVSAPKPGKPQNIWDLEPVSQSELPPELTPIKTIADSRDDYVEEQTGYWGSGQVTPPTAVSYQTIDQLSPILQEQAFPSEPLRSSEEKSKPRFKKVHLVSWCIESVRFSGLHIPNK